MRQYYLACASVLAALGLVGCTDTYSSTDQPVYSSQDQPAYDSSYRSTAITTTDRGYVTDAQGRALYMFVQDQGGPSKCYSACAQAWPPVLAGQTSIAEPVENGLLGQAPRTNEP